jgi:predicted secreted protein
VSLVIYAGWYTMTVIYGVSAMSLPRFVPDFSK